MAKIQLSQRMYSISDVARLLKSGEMQIQPKYQRRRTAWPLSAKTALIDTILSNFPILPIYLRDYKVYVVSPYGTTSTKFEETLFCSLLLQSILLIAGFVPFSGSSCET